MENSVCNSSHGAILTGQCSRGVGTLQKRYRTTVGSWHSTHSPGVKAHTLPEVKEGFGSLTNLCLDRGLNSVPLTQISNTLPVDRQFLPQTPAAIALTPNYEEIGVRIPRCCQLGLHIVIHVLMECISPKERSHLNLENFGLQVGFQFALWTFLLFLEQI
ncbi:unnamed protein product [Timema podura]|uniref:Uncharacterized protein n=1 Tax=Timema podura TaxID=61482 RepID=A0ABN7NT77_TIMPD|nr:unnamed protein product [Timema podura]